MTGADLDNLWALRLAAERLAFGVPRPGLPCILCGGSGKVNVVRIAWFADVRGFVCGSTSCAPCGGSGAWPS